MEEDKHEPCIQGQWDEAEENQFTHLVHEES